MSASDRGTLHIDQALTNVSIGYKNDSFIADQVLPEVPVNKESDKYFIFGKENFIMVNGRRADGAPSNRIRSWTASSDSYNCDMYSIHDVVTDRMRQNADAPLQPDITTTRRLTEIVQLIKEYQVATYLFNTTTFTSFTAAKAAAARWNQYTTSSPLNDVDSAKQSVKKNAGVLANTLVIGEEVYMKLRRHPEILEIYKGVVPAAITPQMLATALQIERVIVGGAVRNSGVEGGTASMGYIWGKYALICYVPKSAAIDEPAMGYNFAWKIYGTGGTVLIEKFRNDTLGGDVIQASKSFDPIVTSDESGYLYSTVID